MDLATVSNEIARLAAKVPVRTPTPMLHSIWLRAAAEAIDPDDSFEIITAGDPVNPTAAAIFRRKPGLVAPRLSLLGGEDVWLHADARYDSPRAAAALADAVVDRGLPAGFGHVTADSDFLHALKNAARGKALVVTGAIAGAPYLKLDPSWSEPEDKFKSRKNARFRNRRKRLEKRGDVKTEIITSSPDNIDGLLDEFITLEAKGWKGRAKTSLTQDPDARAFFRRYARLASEAGIFRVSVMRLDGKLIACRIGAECDGSFWGFKSGFDEAYKSVSPGALLFLEVIRYAANAGLSSYEFLGKMEPWINEWTSDVRPKMRLRCYPYNLNGAVALASDIGRTVSNRFRARFARPNS